ncbi:hypothetical protein KC345_g3735 [Hortaea werneckii]|nr:hypothetical protein KC345_g3735 [Hortaea werneckii]
MEDIDWSDPHFNTHSEFQDAMLGDSDSPFNAFNDFTNIPDQYGADGSSPGLALRTPVKTGPQHQQTPLGLTTGPSAESSSQDSASDSSSRRKRKVSESPISNPSTETGVKQEDTIMGVNATTVDSKIPQYTQAGVIDHQYPTRPMHELSLDQDSGMFDFNSAGSSPVAPRDYNAGMNLNRQVNVPASAAGGVGGYQQSPVQTINPGMFQLNASRDVSPTTNLGMLSNASPQAIFSSNSSTSEETYNGQQAFGGMVQNPAWNQDYNTQFASPGGALGFTPSPVVNGATPSMTSTRSSAQPAGATFGKSPLHIAPISTKSRVETQINVIMTLEKPPPGIEYVHLPLHTIAKSKLLAKEEYDQNKALELHTMLVCTSAMHSPANREKALRKAAAQNNLEIQRRAEQAREQTAADEAEGKQPEDPIKSVSEEDRAASGGEVRICANCIQRERKRAGRKKLKKEEEQQHWERFETERVVVFNSNEYLPLKSPEPGQQQSSGMHHQQDGYGTMMEGMAPQEKQNKEPYTPPEGSLQASAAMRIACYCRHQSEKEGFQVIFTLKDSSGNVVAQQMSDSILITDDHKTHPPAFGPAALAGGGEVFYQPGFAAVGASGMGGPGNMMAGLPQSHSMVDLQSHAYPFPSSRSTGNLQALGFGAQQQSFNPHSHIHQLPASGYSSQATSATMTPTSLSRPASRPASPTSAGQIGPNKKRKSSSFHRKVPSGLTMTPRVDTSQPPSAGLSSAMSNVTSPFSPTGDGGGGGFGQQGSYMTIPTNSGPAQYYGSGPPTPSENQSMFGGGFTQAQLEQHMARNQNAQAYFSHPSSAVPSRASSPVLQQSVPGRSGIAAYARQQGPQTPGGQVGGQTLQQQARQPPQSQMQQQYQQAAMQPQQNMNQSVGGAMDTDTSSPPTITKITPSDGPYVGGTEVSIYGYNFTNGTQVLFGDKLAVTVFYGPQALLATSPPSRPGGVNVTLVPPNASQSGQYQTQPSANRQIFTYTDHNPRMMEMALRYMSQQQTGNASGWGQLASQYATHFMNNNVGRAGIAGGQTGNVNGGGYEASEEKVLDVLDAAQGYGQGGDLDATSEDEGVTILHLAAAAGWSKVVSTLLRQGANPNAADKGEFTPLMHAALHGHINVMRVLLASGANANARSRSGQTAYELAPAEGKLFFRRVVASGQNTGCPPNAFGSMRSGSYADCQPHSATSSRRPSAFWMDSTAIAPARTVRQDSGTRDALQKLAGWNSFSAGPPHLSATHAYSDYLPVGMEDVDWSQSQPLVATSHTAVVVDEPMMSDRLGASILNQPSSFYQRSEPTDACAPLPNMPENLWLTASA